MRLIDRLPEVLGTVEATRGRENGCTAPGLELRPSLIQGGQTGLG